MIQLTPPIAATCSKRARRFCSYLGVGLLLHVAVFAWLCAAAAPPTRAKFEPLYRAGKAIQAATEVGVSLDKFGELLQVLATEIAIAKDRDAAADERTLVEKYSGALSAYQDCRALWSMKIRASDSKRGAIVYKLLRGPSVKEPRDNPGLTVLVERYGIPTTTYKDKGLEWIGIPADSFQVAMAAGGKLLDEANKAYYAEEVPAR